MASQYSINTRSRAHATPCSVCYEPIELQGVLDSCDHVYCYDCIVKWAKVENRCPQCKQRFNSLTMKWQRKYLGERKQMHRRLKRSAHGSEFEGTHKNDNITIEDRDQEVPQEDIAGALNYTLEVGALAGFLDVLQDNIGQRRSARLAGRREEAKREESEEENSPALEPSSDARPAFDGSQPVRRSPRTRAGRNSTRNRSRSRSSRRETRNSTLRVSSSANSRRGRNSTRSQEPEVANAETPDVIHEHYDDIMNFIRALMPLTENHTSDGESDQESESEDENQIIQTR